MKKYPTKIKLILHFLEGSKRFFALSMLFAVLASTRRPRCLLP